MASEARRTGAPLADRLFGEGPRFEFPQAVALLERLFPERRPVGREAEASDEVVRFRPDASLAHPGAAIRAIRPPASSDSPAEMDVTFFGVVGPLGVLPHAYTELLVERGRRRDEALRAFLDLFHHRLLSFFFRAWGKYRLGFGFERGEEHDLFARMLRSLLGLGSTALRGRAGVEDAALLFHAGVLARRPRCAAALAGFLEAYFDAPVRILSLTGAWYDLSLEERTRLGVREGNNTLGASALLGERFFYPQGRFRVRVGPLGWDRLRDFVPGGVAFGALARFVRFYAGSDLACDVECVLRAQEAPGVRLGGGETGAPRLGWSGWLVSRTPGEDLRTDAIPTDRAAA